MPGLVETASRRWWVWALLEDIRTTAVGRGEIAYPGQYLVDQDGKNGLLLLADFGSPAASL